MNNTIIQLLILAGVALFLIFRLKNVLGTRDGFEPKIKDGIKTKEEVKNTKDVNENYLDEEVTEYLLDDNKSAEALSKIKELETDFSLTNFLVEINEIMNKYVT